MHNHRRKKCKFEEYSEDEDEIDISRVDVINEFDEFLENNNDEYLEIIMDNIYKDLKLKTNKRLLGFKINKQTFKQIFLDNILSINELMIDNFELYKWYKELNNFDDTKKDELINLLHQIQQSIKEEEPNLIKILNSQMSLDERKRCIEKLTIMKGYEPYSFEFYCVRNELIDKIKQTNTLTISDKNKLEELEEELLHTNINNIKHKLLNLNTSKENKSIIYSKILKLSDMDNHSGDYFQLKHQIDWLLSLPFDNIKIVEISFPDVKNKLDDQLFGLENVKEQLLVLLNNSLCNPNAKKCIALSGPPGVGKTSIAKAFANAINLPFEIISMGGMKDSTILFGSDNVYMGSSPGLIVKILSQMKYSNGILLFDEVDKLLDTYEGVEIQNALLHITDYVQNKCFRDNFLADIHIDISRLWLFFSMNDSSMLNPALKDRLPIINIKDYDINEKVIITKKYIVPQNNEEFHLNLSLDDELIKYLVSTNISIRNVKRKIYDLFSRINFYKNNKEFSKVSNITNVISKKIYHQIIENDDSEIKTLFYFN